MARVLEVALITLVLHASLHAQRAHSSGHIGGSFSHGPGPSVRFQPQRHPHPYGNHRGGVGYRARNPYFFSGYSYSGYPFPFGYGNDLQQDDGPPLSPEQPVGPAVENADNQAPAFRPAYQAQAPTAPVHAQPATTLVFSDGRPSIEVHNYALTNSTLYALDGETRQEIPLSQLNLAATIEANRKMGVNFALPSGH